MPGIREFYNPEKEKYEKQSVRIIDHAVMDICKTFPEFVYVFDKWGKRTTDRRIRISTDGSKLIFNPGCVVRTFVNEGIRSIERELMHVLFHYLRGDIHTYRSCAHRDVMDVNMDAEVNLMLMMCGMTDDAEGNLKIGRSNYYRCKYDKMAMACLTLQGEKLASDDHGYWLAGDGSDSIENERKIAVRIVFGDETDGRGLSDISVDPAGLRNLMEKLINDHIAGNRTDYDIEFSADHSARKGTGDYHELIRRILSDRIREQETDDIMDRDLYSYGFELYEDMPLIEPGEGESMYQDIGRIAIAIDTSGSCFEEMVKGFLGEIGQIFSESAPDISEESEVVIFECDEKIRCEEHFMGSDINDKAFGKRNVHGGGGTSFIPVFERVRELSDEDPQRSVNALIYLSDCQGTFPELPPNYPVYFVVPESIAEFAEVPEYVELYLYRDVCDRMC